MKNPKVSVIVPIYNKEAFLEKSISSILEQTEKNIEIILADDGSTDGSSEICMKFAEKDSRILYKKKENSGSASARNYGRSYANGEYVAFIDSDDYIEKNALKKMLEHSKNADVVIGGAVNECGKRKILWVMPKELEGFYEGENVRKKILPMFLVYGKHIGKNILPGSLVIFLFKRKFLNEQNIFIDENISYSEDWLFSLEAIFKANSVAVLHNIHYHYITNYSGLTENYNPKVTADYIEVLKNFDKMGVLSCIPEAYSSNPNLILNFFLQSVKNLSLKKDSVFVLGKELNLIFEMDYFKDLGTKIKPDKIYIKRRLLFYLVKFKCRIMLIFLYKYVFNILRRI